MKFKNVATALILDETVTSVLLSGIEANDFQDKTNLKHPLQSDQRMGSQLLCSLLHATYVFANCFISTLKMAVVYASESLEFAYHAKSFHNL
jgi:hypothetical protein